MLRLILVLALLATPAAADCIPFKAMKKGIEVTLQDGSRWLARIGARDVVRIDQTNHDGAFAQFAEGPFGVFPTQSSRNSIGSISIIDYAKAPPQPHSTLNWTANARLTYDSQNGASDVTQKVKVQATGSNFRTAKVSGCDYQVLNIDLAITTKSGTYTLRHAYFPELRFGIQTRLTSVTGEETKTGITAMRALP
jgi:hypothetical protein